MINNMKNTRTIRCIMPKIRPSDISNRLARYPTLVDYSYGLHARRHFRIGRMLSNKISSINTCHECITHTHSLHHGSQWLTARNTNKRCAVS